MGELKPLVFVAGSKKDLLGLPSSVIQRFGYALYLAQSQHDMDLIRERLKLALSSRKEP